MITNAFLEREQLDDLGEDEKIVLKLIAKRQGGRCGLHSFGSEYGSVDDFSNYHNEPLGFLK